MSPRVVAALLTAVAGLVALVLVPAATRGQDGARLLPDLDQRVPMEFEVRVARGRTFLGFASAAENVGAGPLEIRGSRPSRRGPLMRADQLVLRAGGGSDVTRGIGSLRFVRLQSHRHWHLLDFMTYELRTERGYRLVAPDRKSGFCLGDRYRSERFDALPARSPRPVHTSACGLDQPGLREIAEGISVGYGDDYPPLIEGQDVEVTGLRSGRYWLVHRADPEGRVQELRRDNNAAAVLLQLAQRRGGRLGVRVLRRCPDAARC
jgi:hypothetical protein